jgi:hypothetical protein
LRGEVQARGCRGFLLGHTSAWSRIADRRRGSGPGGAHLLYRPEAILANRHVSKSVIDHATGKRFLEPVHRGIENRRPAGAARVSHGGRCRALCVPGTHVRRRWRRNGRSSAPTRRASIELPFRRNSMRMLLSAVKITASGLGMTAARIRESYASVGAGSALLRLETHWQTGWDHGLGHIGGQSRRNPN